MTGRSGRDRPVPDGRSRPARVTTPEADSSSVVAVPRPSSATVRAGLLTAALALTVAACGTETGTRPTGPVTSTTTKIGGAPLIGVDRDADAACPAPSPAEPGRPDPKRIVVIDAALLDGVCALGLQGRVVGRTVDAPVYLGGNVAATPRIADAAAVAADVVLGADTAAGGDWRARFRALAAALGRPAAADRVLSSYTAAAAAAGAKDARRTQASLVALDGGDITVLGTGGFAAGVLADVGVDRPGPQRRPGTWTVPADADAATLAANIDGDVAYVMLVGDRGRDQGADLLRAENWKGVDVANAGRVLIVNPTYWAGPGGPIAARAVVRDLYTSL